MAWTDACKLEAVAQIDRRKEIHGGVRHAIREMSKESGIPYDTLQKWYHPRKNENVAENGYTPKDKEPKQTTTKCNLHTLTFDSGRKKIMFELVETDGNRLLAMQEYRIGRKAKEIPTKNRFAVTMDLIAQFRTALDQAVVIIQERCPVESGADDLNPGEGDEAESPAGDGEGLAQNNEVDPDREDLETSPAPGDCTPGAAERIRCKDCLRYAHGLQLKDKEMNGSCKSQTLSWNGEFIQLPDKSHNCHNFCGCNQQQG
jgi:hypothetical protein